MGIPKSAIFSLTDIRYESRNISVMHITQSQIPKTKDHTMCKTSANVAYIRVSTVDQNTDRQLDGLTFDRTFEDHCSGKDTNRPGLSECLAFLREGDTLHVHSIDRLARNLADLQRMVEDLNAKGIAVHFHKEGLTFSGEKLSPMNKLMFSMLGAFAEFERAIMKERQAEGIRKAKERDASLPKSERAYKGRRARITEEMAEEIRVRKAAGEKVADLAKEYGCTTETIYAQIRKGKAE